MSRKPYRDQRRHPICPQCRFDVGGSLDGGHTGCPECGCELSAAELHREVLPGDWTLAIGCRRLAIALGWRAVALSLIWFALLRAVHLAGAAPLPFGVILWFASVLVGVGLGTVFTLRLFEAAGFISIIVPIAAMLTTAAALAGGLILHATYHGTDGIWVGSTMGAAAGTSFMILRIMLPECWS